MEEIEEEQPKENEITTIAELEPVETESVLKAKGKCPCSKCDMSFDLKVDLKVSKVDQF